MADELVERLLERWEKMPRAAAYKIQRILVERKEAAARIQSDAAEIAALRAALADCERQRMTAVAELAEARGKALEEAAKACEAHMSQCLDDRDIQKRWPQIKARNAVYAQAIRDLARR